MSAVVKPSHNFTEVEINIKCKGLRKADLLSKSDPICYLEVQENGQWIVKDKTEIIKNDQNPEFKKSVKMVYCFHERQNLRFRVMDSDGKKEDSLGSFECRLTQLLGKPLTAPLSNGKGEITLQCEEVSKCKDLVAFRRIKGNMDKKQDYYLVFYRTGEGNPVKIHGTDKKANKSTKTPQWEDIMLTADVMDRGDASSKVKIEVWDWDRFTSDDLIGETYFYREELHSGLGNTLTKDVIHTDKKGKTKKVGELTFEYSVEKGYTFMDYHKAGLDIHMAVAVDLTGSNGDPSDADSLHSQNGNNMYQQVMERTGDVLGQYDSDGKIEFFGFGIKENGQTSHCYPMGENNSSEVQGVNGMLEAYRAVIQKVQNREIHFSGPTNFRHFLRKLNHLGHAETGQPINQCYVGIIMTDGNVDDMEETIQEIVESSHQPIFLVIIGIGEGDPSGGFKKMEFLDNDSVESFKPLSAGGKKQLHDNVQFVQFNKFRSQAEFTNAVLGELPDQIVRFMKIRGVRPGGQI